MGSLGVSGAKTSEESPLKDNKKTADGLKTTRGGGGGSVLFHMNLNAILTGNLPPMRRRRGEEKTAAARTEGRKIELDQTGGGGVDGASRLVSRC